MGVRVEYAVAMKPLSIAEVERRFSARATHATVSFTVRNAPLRKAGYLPLGGRGFNAPPATEQDFIVMTLGLVCSQQSKDVVAGYERVRAFKLDRAFLETEDGERTRIKEEDLDWDRGSSLEFVLLSCFKSCALNPQDFHLRELLVDHSTFAPKAQLSVRESGGDGPAVTHIFMFTGPDAPAGYQREAVESIARLTEHALMAMFDLYAINIQLPPANEFGPSDDADGPGRVVEVQNVQTSTDRRRAPTRKRSKSA
jgi:hypothetical protein